MATDSLHELQILILDFGSQYTQLIARRIREQNVYSEILSHKITAKVLIERKVKAIILSGGPGSVYDKKSIKVDKKIFDLDIPILGICYGQQTLVKQLGGKVIASDKSEFGRAKIKIIDVCSFTKNVWFTGKEYEVWMSHGDKVSMLPDWIVTMNPAILTWVPWAVTTPLLKLKNIWMNYIQIIPN